MTSLSLLAPVRFTRRAVSRCRWNRKWIEFDLTSPRRFRASLPPRSCIWSPWAAWWFWSGRTWFRPPYRRRDPRWAGSGARWRCWWCLGRRPCRRAELQKTRGRMRGADEEGSGCTTWPPRPLPGWSCLTNWNQRKSWTSLPGSEPININIKRTWNEFKWKNIYIYFFMFWLLKDCGASKFRLCPMRQGSESLILTGVSDILKTEYPKTNKKV